jgi:hypothetical protein
MTDKNEDEVDWSDGTIDDPTYASTPPSGNSGYAISPPHREDGHDHVVEPQKNDEYTVPTGTPLSPGMCRFMAKVYQLTMISYCNPFHNKDTARSNRRTSEPSSAIDSGLSSFCVVSGESEGIRGHLS